MPEAWLFTYFPLPGRSVSALRVTSYESDESCFFHSASVLTTRAICIFPRLLPEGENCSIVTIADGLGPDTPCPNATRVNAAAAHPPIAFCRNLRRELRTTLCFIEDFI